jgi:hypothetical protein
MCGATCYCDIDDCPLPQPRDCRHVCEDDGPPDDDELLDDDDPIE